MTTTKEATMARLEAQAVAEELRQFIANDYDLYRQQETPIRANLERKVKRGTYNHDKAPKLWLYLVTSGARKYVKEHCSKGDTIRRIFPLKMREELAQKLADDWAIETYLLLGENRKEIDRLRSDLIKSIGDSRGATK